MGILTSVIITSYHTRTQYLNDAINSVMHQTLSKRLYEVIIVKDYEDANISKLASNKDNNIINLTIDDTNIGDAIVHGVKKAKGEIICFLDDDDMFFGDKLEFVYNQFSNDKNLGFLRNEISEIDKNGNKTVRPNEWGDRTKEDIEISIKSNLSDEILRNSGLMSCISIKRNIILPHLEILSQLTTNQDLFMFLIALYSNKKLKIVKNQLTYYRISDSVTRIKGSFNKYLSTLRRIHKNDYIINSYLENMFKNVNNNDYIKKKIFELNMIYFLVSEEKGGLKYISSNIKNREFSTLKNRFFLLFLSLFHDVSPNFFFMVHFIYYKIKMSKIS